MLVCVSFCFVAGHGALRGPAECAELRATGQKGTHQARQATGALLRRAESVAQRQPYCATRTCNPGKQSRRNDLHKKSIKMSVTHNFCSWLMI